MGTSWTKGADNWVQYLKRKLVTITIEIGPIVTFIKLVYVTSMYYYHNIFGEIKKIGYILTPRKWQWIMDGHESDFKKVSQV